MNYFLDLFALKCVLVPHNFTKNLFIDNFK